MTRPLLEVRRLRKTFAPRRRGGSPVRAVTDVSFDLREGEVLGLVGESGSGKSTIGQCLVHLHRPDGGEILLDGENLATLPRGAFRRRRTAVQMIFQDPSSALNPRMSVGDALREALRLHSPHAGRDVIEERLERLLRLIGLQPEHASRYPHQLSGGQKQRIGIARAIAVEPRCLIADEAVSALDVSIQAQIITLLGDLQQSLGLTMLFISHDLGVVRYVADRVAVLYLGRLVEIGPARDIFAAPAHPYTQALLAAIPDPARPLDESAILDDPAGPDPRAAGGGCAFAPRCPHVMDLCRKDQPFLTQVAADHTCACVLRKIHPDRQGETV
ncbi:MAG: ABC transporter ATP-binding protein [Rhodospirillum sp.]|nr:ABC transporter ATP-binding protein [Rhodospirillum sp.]MCF8489740.1 ABC transporter ATP-binding protein [Rhodospirillum sp.]